MCNFFTTICQTQEQHKDETLSHTHTYRKPLTTSVIGEDATKREREILAQHHQNQTSLFPSVTSVYSDSPTAPPSPSLLPPPSLSRLHYLSYSPLISMTDADFAFLSLLYFSIYLSHFCSVCHSTCFSLPSLSLPTILSLSLHLYSFVISFTCISLPVLTPTSQHAAH